tara:strand:- start:1881 stop:2315 length:435 start_codon:yes stop_codon:yes gene_type:complete
MASNYERTFGLTAIAESAIALTEGGHLGSPIVFTVATSTATLPPATGSGNKYQFFGSVDASAIVVQVTTDDTMAGVAYLGNDSAASSNFYTADTSDTITLNGSTKGGLKGYRIECRDIASNLWAVIVQSEASGNEATPFSAAVS